jgi:hypothetical protein
MYPNGKGDYDTGERRLQGRSRGKSKEGSERQKKIFANNNNVNKERKGMEESINALKIRLKE